MIQDQILMQYKNWSKEVQIQFSATKILMDKIELPKLTL